MGQKLRFPRTRGVVSYLRVYIITHHWFSPHTRGCICQGSFCFSPSAVFPAHAGLYRACDLSCHAHCSFPRTRGVVSTRTITVDLSDAFSPHTRGCIVVRTEASRADEVFPAHAGLYLTRRPTPRFPSGFPAHAGLYRNGLTCRARMPRFPRTRGVVSRRVADGSLERAFSPHTRGCI